MIDNSEISLAQFVFANIYNLQLQAGQSWVVPTLDCFAGHAKGQHQVSKSYIMFYGHGVVAVNAMYHKYFAKSVLLSGCIVQQMRLVLRSPKHNFALKKTLSLVLQGSCKFC